MHDHRTKIQFCRHNISMTRQQTQSTSSVMMLDCTETRTYKSYIHIFTYEIREVYEVTRYRRGQSTARGDELGAHGHCGQEPRAAGTISTADPKTGDPTIQSYLAIQPGWRSEREALRSATRPRATTGT
eukprot:1185007-Prorocentrum_minimum.AAC.3